jgi:hypothetical protein
MSTQPVITSQPAFAQLAPVAKPAQPAKDRRSLPAASR